MKANAVNRLLSFTLTRYLLVGIGAVAIDVFTYFLLIHFTLITPSLAKKISFIVGAIWSYVSNKKFTFRISNVSWYVPLLFGSVYFLGFLLNSIVHDFVYNLSSSKIWSVGTATVISVGWNFVGQKFIVFSKKSIQND
ncbi:MAG: GtrA family protein [Chitinophagia bacterium]|nr:GtrA family protein [Chitinophagia bacterium]